MKVVLIVAALCSSSALTAELCNVEVCNDFGQISTDTFSHLKNSSGEMCLTIVLPKEQAVVGKMITSESKWIQEPSIDLSKRGNAKVNAVHDCFAIGGAVYDPDEVNEMYQRENAGMLVDMQ